jgi:hypothetical protein
MISKTSRRAILAGAAVLPALAVPAFAAASIKDDPTFAAVDRARKGEEEFLALARSEDAAEGGGIKLDKAPDDHRTPEMVATVKEAIAARIALASTVPTTPAGLAALTTFIRERSVECSEFYFAADNPDEQLLFVASLDAAARGMSGMKPWAGQTNPPTDDPIFAAIDAHKRASAEAVVAGKEASRRGEQLRKEGVPLREIVKICDSISDAASDADTATRDAIVSCEPTTWAGVTALLSYVAKIEGNYPDGDTLLTVITNASRAANRPVQS